MSKYRDRLQIIADILSIANGRSTRKTQIMYQANLSYRLLVRYLKEVTEAGLVLLDNEEFYVLTARGKAFLSRHAKYSKRCKGLERHLTYVNNDRATLEKMCSGSSRVNSDLKLSDSEHQEN